MRGLEDTLGQPLFRRFARRLELTPAGLRLAHALREGFDTLEAGVQALRARSATGDTVTLSTNTAFAAKWVLPRMAAFGVQCPGINLRLHASDALVDLVRGDADIAIRSGLHGDWPGVEALQLMQEHYAPVCSPRLGLARVADLGRHPLIHCDWQPHASAPALWSRWFKEAGLAERAGKGRARKSDLSFSDETHALLAALSGHGVALLSLTLAAEELRSGALVQPFGPLLSTGSYFLATAKGGAASRRWMRCGSGSLGKAELLDTLRPCKKSRPSCPSSAWKRYPNSGFGCAAFFASAKTPRARPASRCCTTN